MTSDRSFEYEIRKRKLNLYTRGALGRAEDVLIFLHQVPYQGNVKEAVQRAYKERFQTQMTSFQACIFRIGETEGDLVKLGPRKEFERHPNDPKTYLTKQHDN
ncbi:MAG: hypothetical protein ABH864_00690 [archaeon]